MHVIIQARTEHNTGVRLVHPANTTLLSHRPRGSLAENQLSQCGKDMVFPDHIFPSGYDF